ncbi:MAG: UvrD-helicase domain-containing protein [bacterium]|nr:UvrD-helicase domain-containing protein [bacterium]
MAILDKDINLKFPQVFLIDASAGSGKTHTLTQRFVQLILSNQIEFNKLENILAITFTNNSTREMKTRILDWLKKIVIYGDCDERKQTLELVNIDNKGLSLKASEAIENIISNYSDFHVQTIDSFMNKVLRSSVVELGLPLEVEITETNDVFVEYTISLILKVVKEGLDKNFKKEIDDFLKLLVQEGSSYPWKVADKIEKTFSEFLTKEGKVLEELSFEDKTWAIDEKFPAVEKAYKKLVDEGLAEKLTKGVKEAMQAGDMQKLVSNYSPKIGRLKKTDEDNEAVKGWANLAPLMGEIAELVSSSKYHHYGGLYERFKEALDRVKKEKEIIHIADINKKLSGYISKTTVPEIYYRLGDVLYHFLIDEFQDTDRVQWKSMNPLIEETLSKNGSLFTVGDLKQAIYLFRNADYKIMKEMGEIIKEKKHTSQSYIPLSAIENAEIKTLDTNYRSGGVILDYVEKVFKGKLKKQVEEGAFQDRTGLTEYIQEPTSKKKENGYVEVRIIDSENNENSEKDALIEILNDVKNRCPYKDIAILARTNDEIEKIVEWLTEKGIPAASFSSLDIRMRKVIMEIVSILKFLDSPIDNLSFATFISGDVFMEAVKSKEYKLDKTVIFDFIFNASQDNDKSSYLYIKFREKFESLWTDFFEELYKKVGYYPVYDLVSLIYRIFNIFENFGKETGFLLKLLESTSVIEAKGMNNIKELIKMITDEGEKSIFNILLPDYIDSVKVMTIHKSKGLGFPVVINVIYDSSISADNMLFEKDGDELKIYHITKSLAEQSKRLKSLYYEDLLSQKIQFLNCLYVANTRAKEELYNIVIPKKEGKSHNECLDLFENYKEGTKKKDLKAEGREGKQEDILLPEKREIGFSKEEGQAWSIERLLEVKKGSFIHNVLSKIEFLEGDIRSAVNNIVGNALKSTKESYDIKKITDVIVNFLNKEEIKIWFEKRANRVIKTEVEYSDKEGALYRLDRVVEDIDMITVIDFKTGGEDLNQYMAQVKNYMELLRKEKSDKEIKGYLVSLDTLEVKKIQ